MCATALQVGPDRQAPAWQNGQRGEELLELHHQEAAQEQLGSSFVASGYRLRVAGD